MAAIAFDELDSIDAIARASARVEALAMLIISAGEHDENRTAAVVGEMLQGEAAAIQAALAGLIKGGQNNE